MSERLVRRATRSDVPAIAEVFLAARRSILHIVPMVHPDDTVAPWLDGLVFANGPVWVAEEDGRIVAMMALSRGWLDHLYVHPDRHGQGIGETLLIRAKNSPEAIEGLDLWTFQDNLGARRFYERHGFAAAEFTDGAANEEKTPDIRYEWRPVTPSDD